MKMRASATALLIALRSVMASIRVTFCCSGVGSKKSRGIAGESPHQGDTVIAAESGEKLPL